MNEDRLSNEAAAQRAKEGLEAVRESSRNVDWNAALLHQTRENQMQNGMKVFNQMKEINDRAEAERLERAIAADDSIAAAIAHTPYGGKLSQDLVRFMNRNRGIEESKDGSPVNGQIIEGGYNPKTGGYRFVTATVGSDGSVEHTPHDYSPGEVYGMMRNHPGFFDEEKLSAHRDHVRKNFDGSLTDDAFEMFAKTSKDRYDKMRERIDRLNGGTQNGSAGVEIAKINAASREKVAGINTVSREKIAGAQIASREKIAEAANVLKQYGIDVSAELKDRGYDLQEERNAEASRHNKESEGIAGSRLREQERHNENRLQNDKDKAARAADQRDAELAERKRQFDEHEKRLSKPKDQGGAGEDSRKAVSAMKGMLELARTSGMSEEDLADLESWTNERIKGLAGIGGETSGDGGTKGKVKYTDLKPGQKFTMTDKDGKKRRCVKTEKGYKYID